jgi:hypothetical protein
VYAMQEMMIAISPRASDPQPRRVPRAQEPASGEPDDAPVERELPCEVDSTCAADSTCGIFESRPDECAITESGCFGDSQFCLSDSNGCSITGDSTCPPGGQSLCEPGQSDCPPQSICPPGSQCVPPESICLPISCPEGSSICPPAESRCGPGTTTCHQHSICWNESLACGESACEGESRERADESKPDPADPDSSFDLDELKAALLRKLQA